MAGPLTMFVLSTMVAVASAYPTSPSTHMNAKHPAHVRHEDPFNGQSNAVMVFFVAMGFCLLIMTPVLWVLYAMRNEQREAERSHIPQPGLAKDLEGPAAMPTSQSAREHEVSTGTTKGRVAKLRDSITKVNGYVSEMRARVPSLPASVSEMRQQVSDKLWILRSRICSWFSRNKLPKTRISPGMTTLISLFSTIQTTVGYSLTCHTSSPPRQPQAIPLLDRPSHHALQGLARTRRGHPAFPSWLAHRHQRSADSSLAGPLRPHCLGLASRSIQGG